MEENIFATKGNLIAAKKSHALSLMGYELMDKKRNILVRELMNLVDKARSIQSEIADTFDTAYKSLQRANISCGICSDISDAQPIEDSVEVRFRSVMGVELPVVSMEEKELSLPFGIESSDSSLDIAYINFIKVKKLCAALAEVENSIYRLADEIKKTRKRANALQNVIIPKSEQTIKFISEALEEKEREEFSRLKVLKSKKERQNG